MYFFHFSLLPHWGIMLNQHGFNKSRPAINFIPPTTIIGALSYPLNRLLNEPECFQGHSASEKYKRIFESVNVKMPMFSVYHDISRVLFIHRGVAEFDAVAVGKLYKSAQSCIEVIMIVNEDRARETLGNKWKELLRIACMSINRIGARESIVTPIEVKEGLPEPISDKIVITNFSFQSHVARVISGEYVTGNVVDWKEVPIGSYVNAKTVGYIVPMSRVEVELLRDYKAYKCGGEVVIPWQ